MIDTRRNWTPRDLFRGRELRRVLTLSSDYSGRAFRVKTISRVTATTEDTAAGFAIVHDSVLPNWLIKAALPSNRFSEFRRHAAELGPYY
jgi:hypothetical protein